MAGLPASSLRRPHAGSRRTSLSAYSAARISTHGRLRLRRACLGRRLSYRRPPGPFADGAPERAVRQSPAEGCVMTPAFQQARRCLNVGADLTILWGAARFVARRLDPERRRRLSTRLAHRTLGTLGVRVTRSGDRPPLTEPMLVVANHVSWLDVYVLNSCRPMRFLAKSETRSWPIIGTIADRFDSLFIVRGSCRD